MAAPIAIMNIATAPNVRTAPTAAGHFSYRPDIDGLRALAVGLVIGYHFFPNHVRAGFIGVDIFFVISGYLISSIILGQLERGGFSYRAFYTRRINRIFPALALVLIANLVLGWYALLIDEFQAFGKHVAASSAFLSNFALWKEAGYFDSAAHTKPLLHLWSLAIEEQFYIGWPLLLSVIVGGRRRLLTIVALIAAASFTYNVYAAGHDPAAAYYSPASRCWQLGVGGLLAYAQGHLRYRMPLSGDVRATIGVVSLFVAILLIGSHDYPGWWALLPTVGTALLISGGDGALVNRMVFAWRPLVWLGLISYPLYLWHWPVLVWAKLVSMTDSVPASWRVGLIALSVLLAWLTYVSLEKPVKRHNHGTTAFVLFAVIMLAGVAGVLVWANALSNRMSGADLARVVAATKDWDYPPASFRPYVRFFDYSFYRRDGSGPGATLFVGDSNMEQYAPRIEAVVDRQAGSPSVIFATKGGCPFVAPVLADKMHDCKGKLQKVDELIRSSEVTTVVFGQAWHNLAGLLHDQAIVASFEARLSSVPAGKAVFIILNIPAGLEFSPTSLLRGSRLHHLEYRADAGHVVDESVARVKYERVHAVVREIAARHGATVLDPFDTFCYASKCPLVDRTGTPLYKDAAHVTASRARESALFIDATLKPIKP